MPNQTSKEQRSKIMKAVKAKDSKIEIKLRKALWERGYRYRKHYRKLPGTPDIVFVKAKLAIFCDSEFWHGKNWDERKHDHKSNQEFWISKIERNIVRDNEVNQRMEQLGWKVLRFWGKDIINNTSLIVNKIIDNLGGSYVRCLIFFIYLVAFFLVNSRKFV
jgi:DNA mismatch endonuclease (patch repair protein)